MSANIYGRTLADAAFDDIESFFFKEVRFRVNRELDAKTLLHASCRGKGMQTRIRLSKSFCDNQIYTLSDYLMSLLVVSHELAHYLNYHNEHADRPDSKDKVAIEARADNFGAIIMRTILSFGVCTNRLLKKIIDGEDINGLHAAMGDAIRRVHDGFYVADTSGHYPHPVYRVYSVVAGGLSFYHRWFKFSSNLCREMSSDFAVSYALNVMRGGNLSELNIPASVMNDGGEIQNAIFEIHTDLQRNHAFMNSGLKPVLGFFLTSNFQSTEDERRAYREHLAKLIGIETMLA